ncbi:MAG: cytochrome b [Bradyrhizobium sp.]|nr:MAG: cytochrome b [Bradyrhizobium sp.]
MPMRNDSQAYGAAARFAHWATALCVFLAWPLGMFRNLAPRGAPRDTDLFIHMTLGLGVLLLLVFRLAWRALDPPPPAVVAPRFEPWIGYAAKAGHILLYVLLIATPLLGIVLQFARGQALPLFGLLAIPSPWAFDRDLVGQLVPIHQFAGDALCVMAIGHAGAALFHHWILRDRTLTRMLPVTQR